MRFLLALQTAAPGAADTLAAAAPVAAPVAVEPTFTDQLAGGFGLLFLGGWPMIPILLLSILTVVIVWERLRVLKRARQSDPEALARTVADYVHAGDLAGAAAFCRSQDTPAARILSRGLQRLGRPIAEIKESVAEAGRREALKLEERMDLLASTAAIAPMIGFFGTVTGMIAAFRQIQRYEGAVNPSLLAGGIWEALVTTAAGLAVGILALFCYNVLVGRINRTVNGLEQASSDFLDVLQSPAAAPARPVSIAASPLAR